MEGIMPVMNGIIKKTGKTLCILYIRQEYYINTKFAEFDNYTMII